MMLTCHYCGKPFENQHKNRKFCSKECMDKGKHKVGTPPQLCPHGILGKKKCLQCQRDYFRNYAKKWRELNKEQYRKRIKKWGENNKEKTQSYSRKYYWKNRETEIIRGMKFNAKRYHNLRLIALIHYGGDPPKCSCCGEYAIPFLCIDHIEGGGNNHRKNLGRKTIFEWLKQNNYPEGFRVLCYNCNSARGHYGECPHQKGYEYKGVKYEPIKI